MTFAVHAPARDGRSVRRSRGAELAEMLNCPWDLEPGMFMPWTYRHKAAMLQLKALAAPRPSGERAAH
ncbi:MAG: hypothetical protein OXH76_19740 [Boseongicola sp.]|nr:hypothetical protein [Boseongicola sp.]